MPVPLIRSDEVLQDARTILDTERARLAERRIPGELTLTGAASLPGLLTRGDVDLHLRVPADTFDQAVTALGEAWTAVHPDIWTPEFATFDVPGSPRPTGVAVTAVGGEHDRRFTTAWQRLAASPSLRNRLNDVKRRHAAGDDAAYESAKSAFFSGLGDNAPMPPFHFLADARAPMPARDLGELARRAETLGYHALVVPDHLIGQLAPVPAMAVIAAATSRLRISGFVLNNDLRHPAVLAQDLASLDVLSEGRLDVALGGGWNEPEYTAIGIPFDPVPVRIARLTEAVAVLKGCFAEGPFSFAGEHYTITDYDAGPQPAQHPHPPFLIGGGGRRVLGLAAREAQIVGLAPRTLPGRRVDPRSLTWAATEEKIGWVREAAGDRFADLEFNVYPSAWPVTVTADLYGEARRLIDSLRERSGTELTEQEVIDSPHLFIGSLERFEEKFLELRERLGITSIMVGEPGPLDTVVERLATA